MSYTVLIVDDEENFRSFTVEYFAARGYETRGAATLSEARECLKRGDGDVVVLDVTLPDGYGPSLLYETANMTVRPPIIIITAHGDIEMAVDAMKNGDVQLVFNTTEGAQALSDSRSLRRAALLHKVPYYTTIAGAVAVSLGIEAYWLGSLEVRPLQAYFATAA